MTGTTAQIKQIEPESGFSWGEFSISRRRLQILNDLKKYSQNKKAIITQW